MQTRIAFIIAAAGLLAAAGTFAASAVPPVQKTAASMVVYKSPTCGCCSTWVEHVRSHGFQVQANDVTDSRLSAVKIESAVPADLQSCHTATIGGYVIEGHVPADDIQRLLADKPAIAGIGVAGMPMGSPGMEQGGMKQRYSTMAFTRNGAETVFARH
jgi:hypothetical protein